MKALWIIAGIAAGCCLSTSALSDDGAVLAKTSGCLICHSVDKRIVGPAYKEVAKKYKGNADAAAMLAKKVSDGGSGTWGAVPMPPNKGKVAEADIKKLVAWVLSQ